MKLKWLGHSCFELTLPGGVLVTDPFDGTVGYPMPRVRADAVLSSHGHFDHGDGFRSVYMHMCKRPYVRKGDFVSAGHELGCVGSTGTSTGNHLHFGISQYSSSKGKYEYVNPLLYIKN